MSLARKVMHCLLMLAMLEAASCRRPSSDSHTRQMPDKDQGNSTAVPQAQVSPISPTRPSGPVHFVDVTSKAGIHFKHHSGAFGNKYLPETMGSGVCFIDYDNDGWQDIFFVNSTDWPGHQSGTHYPALYHNNKDGTFTEVTRSAGLAVEMYGMGCAVGDFDNDGYDDIYVTGVGQSRLFKNLGNGKFADVTARAGIADPGFSTSAVWFDYDNDGKLDLFVSHYVDWSVSTDQNCTLDGTHKSYCTPAGYNGQSAKLYHNKGNGRFEDVTKQAGLYDPTSKSLGIALLDYDSDGWLDLFVANDTQPNKLYHNNHNGTFTDVAVAAGVAFSDAGSARAGMGVDAADYDNSGRQSLVIGNFTNESMSLYHNDGAGLFTDEATSSGIGLASTKSLTFSCLFFDYDLDGLPDIFAANGHVADDISTVQPTMSYAQLPQLFHNQGHGKFEEVSSRSGSPLRQAMVARGAAYGDIDNDGDLDLVLTTSNGPAHLLRNDNGNQNDVLRLKLIGTRSNRDAIGAKVTLHFSDGLRISQMVKSGSSYLSQSEFPLTFGWGRPRSGRTVDVDVAWPSGRRDKLNNVTANQFITVQEGAGIVASKVSALLRGK